MGPKFTFSSNERSGMPASVVDLAVRDLFYSDLPTESVLKIQVCDL